MKNWHICTLIFISLFLTKPGNSQTGKIGIGLKAGDPTGLTVKFYRDKYNLELVAGRMHYLNAWDYTDNYYSDRFYRQSGFGDKNIYQYDNVVLSKAIALQLHFLRQQHFTSVPELSWYIGLGPQMQTAQLEYFYRYKVYTGHKNDYYWETGRTSYSAFELGLDGVIGMEYTFKDVPVSVFADMNAFIAFLSAPFAFQGQAGIGVRYNLK